MAIKSNKGKGQYATYKTENRAYKNKLRKLARHAKKHPNDEENLKALDRLSDPKNFKIRTKPLVPGSNQTIPKRRYTFVSQVETAGEQLSRLLGIPMPKVIKRRPKAKAAVTVKKRKNVKKS
jgi:hypothetical protein